MDPPEPIGKENPWRTANIFSKLTFWSAQPLIRRGYKEELKKDQFFKINDEDQTSNVVDKLEREWEKESQKLQSGKFGDFRLALARALGKSYALYSIVLLMEDICRLLQTVLFMFMMEYFSLDSSMSTTDAYLYAFGIALCTLAQSVLGTNIVYNFMHSGMTWQAATAGLIYRKALKLSHSAIASTTTGQIVDLVSHDVEKLDWLVWSLNTVWLAPLHAIVILTILYYEIGPSVFFALAVMAVIWPIQVVLSKLVSLYRKKNYEKLDERVTIISDMISGMRVIKMYCWEMPFGEIVRKIRLDEMNLIWVSRKFLGMLKELSAFSGRLVTSVVIVAFLLMDNQISAAKIFPMLSLFTILSHYMMDELSWFIQHWLEIGVSVSRIQKFLLAEERTTADKVTFIDKCENNIAIAVDELTASWTPVVSDAKVHHYTLKNVSFKVKQGELLGITGSVGCGKSSLLSTLISELPPVHGSVRICGRVAYASQQPWIFSSTVRQNILFGHEFEEARYNRVLQVTALDKDLSLFPHHDLTLVGEKGVTLSGGQKARINLARTLYSEADIYLLDDPLSAVDASVGRHIFNQCIKSYLKGKTCILVTHQLQYLKEVDRIVLMKEGQIEAIDSYGGLSEMKKEFFRDLTKETQEVELFHAVDDSDDACLIKPSEVIAEALQEEDREVGAVGLECFTGYFTSGNKWPLLLCFGTLCLVTQAAYNMADWWLSEWTNAEERKNDFLKPALNLTTSAPLQDDMNSYGYMGIYLGITASTLFLGLSRTFSFYRIAFNSSNSLHHKMYNSVIRAPIRFFDKNPKGRVINRFSGDIGTVDYGLPETMFEFLKFSAYLLGNLIVMVVVNPFLILAIVPLAMMTFFVRKAYLRSQRVCERISSAAHSPIFTHLSATLEGLLTIRSADAESKCIDGFDGHYDSFLNGWHTQILVFAWFQIRNNFLTAVLNVVAVFLCVIMADYIETGQVGLSLSYLLPMMWYVESVTRLSADMEIEMVATERVLRYTKLESEAPTKTDFELEPDWPRSGSLKFENVSLSYNQDDPVLKDLCFTIHSGERIGIVGRTGAGKSSIIQALFRLTEFTGNILLDGQPIKLIGLHDVRNCISIIPQDPTLFCGTIRSNLDPFEEHTDVELWAALQKVQLEAKIKQLEGGLDASVSETGSNFSVGQRQLICLARAVLCNNRLLVMDEATANVDKATDELIQETIRKSFSSCTLLTIAHRLNTVMDLDKIMVMEEGRMVEFDEPYTLIQKKSSALYKMAAATGPKEFQRLRLLAKKSSEERRQEPWDARQAVKNTEDLNRTALNGHIHIRIDEDQPHEKHAHDNSGFESDQEITKL